MIFRRMFAKLYSYGVLLFVLLLCFATKSSLATWYPQLSNESLTKVIYRPIGQNDEFSHLLERLSHESNVDLMPLQWTTVTGFRSSDSSSWVVLGGSRKSDNFGFTVLPKSQVAVIACELRMATSLSGIQMNSCQLLEFHNVDSSSNGPTLMGAALSSVSLQTGGALLLYCDPLWRSSAGFPIGRCTQRLRRLNTWTSKDDASFYMCSTSPCASGLSIDLTRKPRPSYYRRVQVHDHIGLLMGLPYGQPTGEVRVIDDLLQHFNYAKNGFQLGNSFTRTLLTSPQQFGFGTTVAWTPAVDNYQDDLDSNSLLISAANKTEPSWVDEKLILAASSNTISVHRLPEASGRLVLKIGPVYYNSSFFPEDAFAGFGLALESVKVRSMSAILIGVPYAKSFHQLNSGRVYIVCPGRLDEDIDNNLGVAKVSHLNGSQANALFGYAIARIGDVDGDGVEDVAIGAPGVGVDSKSGGGGEGYSSIAGSVTLYRVTEQCEFDPIPLQVLQARQPAPNDGFGFHISRGFDIDNDKLLEFAVTSLKSSPAIFTMPNRLRAKCRYITTPGLSGAFIEGAIITVKFHINLIDPSTGQPIEIPHGLSSSATRLHQVDPDVDWQKYVARLHAMHNQSTTNHHYNQQQQIEEVFFFGEASESSQLFSSRPRFSLAGLRVVRENDRTLSVTSRLRAMYDVAHMQLYNYGLRVAYRSIINPEGPCSHERPEEEVLCSKAQQPLIDWTHCSSQLEVGQPKCPGSPRCSADLELDVIALVYGDSHSEPFEPVKLVKFADHPHNLPKEFKVRLSNGGPTKAQGVRVQLRVKGNIDRGIRVRLTDVKVTQNGYNVGSNWLTKISRNEELGLASILNDWMFPDEVFELSVSFLIDGMNTNDADRTKLSNGQTLDASAFNLSHLLPSIEVNVVSGVEDPDEANNRVVQAFKVDYEPRVAISLLSIPKTIIDVRSKPTYIFRGMRLPDKVIGPMLKHSFLIENRGRVNLADVTFKLELPFKTMENDPILYLVNMSKTYDSATAYWKRHVPQLVGSDGRPRGECFLPSIFYNPLGLTVFTRYTSDPTYDSEHKNYPEISLSDAMNSTFVSARPLEFKRHRRLELSCSAPLFREQPYDASARLLCLQVLCRLDKLPQGDAVRLTWTGWLWSNTAFKLRKSDIEFTSHLSLQSWGRLPSVLDAYPPEIRGQVMKSPTLRPRLDISQRLVFPRITPEPIHLTLRWPIIVGIVVGILILAFIIAVGFFLGCFKRRNPWLVKHGGQKVSPPPKPAPVVPVAFSTPGTDGDRNESTEWLLEDGPDMQRVESPQPSDQDEGESAF